MDAKADQKQKPAFVSEKNGETFNLENNNESHSVVSTR